MSCEPAPLSEVAAFFNGKAAKAVEGGEFTLYGSNGPIGRTKAFNHDNAIIMGRVGAYCGSVEICREQFWASDNTIVVRARPGYDLGYLYYRLLSFPLHSYAGGAAQPLLTQTILNGIKLPIIRKLKTQERIAAELSAYDDLIENNRRRIQLLEESARLLYKEWFVQLRFPGHEHVKVIDGVPEGWERRQVKDLLARVKRPPKVQKAEFLDDGPIPCIDQSKDFIGGYTANEDAVVNLGIPVIVFGDHTRILKFVDFPFASGADGTQLVVSNDPKVSQEYFYFALDSIDLSNYFYARHFKFLKDQPVLCPPSLLVNQFTEFARATLTQTSALRLQSRKLAQARDLLLPRLMNGEVAA